VCKVYGVGCFFVFLYLVVWSVCVALFRVQSSACEFCATMGVCSILFWRVLIFDWGSADSCFSLCAPLIACLLFGVLCAFRFIAVVMVCLWVLSCVGGVLGCCRVGCVGVGVLVYAVVVVVLLGGFLWGGCVVWCLLCGLVYAWVGSLWVAVLGSVGGGFGRWWGVFVWVCGCCLFGGWWWG